MKTKRMFATRNLLYRGIAIRYAMCLCGALLAVHAHAATNYVAHEWGTFTSVQGSDGNLLLWHALQTSELPGFVYNWNRPGMNRGRMIGGKGVLTTLQRMETPVIYFYADKPLNV